VKIGSLHPGEPEKAPTGSAMTPSFLIPAESPGGLVDEDPVGYGFGASATQQRLRADER
jgi:hypothetical protein